MANHPLQTSLFEEDYLLRELGQVAHIPQVALTELVANAWDAGASRVDIVLPTELSGTLTVTDDGHGMTPAQFKQRWMTLRYNRERHQTLSVEFPPGRSAQPRRAYGRNGVGRHGLLCFADEYEVQTWRDGVSAAFVIATESGPSPFVLRSETDDQRTGSGTRLSVQVVRHLPDPEEILTVLASRFVHDPEFEVRVNGRYRSFDEIEGRVSEETIDLGDGHTATIIVIDSSRVNHSSIHQGIAFWVQRRLVGTPSWSLGQVDAFDGRTRFARRYKVVVDTEGYESDVEDDWAGFQQTDAVRLLYENTAKHIRAVAQTLAAEVIEEASEDALVKNRVALQALGQGARLGVATFTKDVANAQPTISPDTLEIAVKAVINLENARNGTSLLQKLSVMEPEDVDGLDRLLSDWSIKDALRVLDEIDNRLSVIETIRRLSDDPSTDELHTLHPLILRSRWLFGPEFESEEYCSNVTLKTVAKELFNNTEARFINDRNRPDIVVLPHKTTWQMTGLESFDPSDATILQLRSILLIELKKGGFELTRKEINQAGGYVQDIAESGAITGTPYISAWVVGHKVATGVEKDTKLGTPEYGRVRATTFGALVDTANVRLMKLREILQERYSDVATDELLSRVLSQPTQEDIRFEATESPDSATNG